MDEKREVLVVGGGPAAHSAAGAYRKAWDEVRFADSPGGGFLARYGCEGGLVGILAHEDDEAYEDGWREIEERAAWR